MMRFNPQTGQMEDDGQPDPLLAVGRDAMAPAGIDPNQGARIPPLPTDIVGQPDQQLPPAAPQVFHAEPMEIQAAPPVANVPSPPVPKAPKPTGLQGDLARVSAEQDAAARQKGVADVAKAEAQVGASAEEQRVREEHAARAQVIQQQTDAEVARRQGELDDESAKYKSMGFKDFWSDKTTGARVLGAIAVGLGAAGAALTGSQNTALAIIDKAIDRDYQRQRDTILKQKDVVTEARQGVEGARAAKADKLLALENWRKNAYEVTEAKTRGIMARQGVPEAEANNSTLLAGVHEKALESKLALDKGIAQVAEIKSSTAKNYAEIGKIKADAGKEKAAGVGRAAGHQMDMALYGTGVLDALKNAEGANLTPAQMAEAVKKVQDNETSLKAVDSAHGVTGVIGTRLGRAIGITPRSRIEGLSAAEQQFVNGLDIASKKTATIIAGQGHANAHEMMESFQIRPGDTPEVINQKLGEMRAFGAKAVAEAGAYGVTAEKAGAAAAAQPTARPSTAERILLQKALEKNPNDPRADKIRALLAL